MSPFVKALMKKIKLGALWFKRILFAPNHFQVPFPVKLKMNLLGFTSDQYALYDLKGSRYKQYLSEFDWYRSRWVNEPFDEMLNNKVVCAGLLAPYVLVPKVLAVKTKGEIVFLDGTDGLRTPRELIGLIDAQGAVFLKPIRAGKGEGVHRVEIRNRAFVLDGAASCESEVLDLLGSGDEWFMSAAVEQSGYLNDLFPDSANTVRLITLRDPRTEQLRVFYAVQRIGTSHTAPVDNGSRGGLVAKIDIESGVLSEARTLHSLDAYAVHPDTGALIEGMRIPVWDEMKECALGLAEKFPYLRFVAWDLLATDSGVCVIEANASSGVNIIQLWGPQRFGELGDFYRAQGVLR